MNPTEVSTPESPPESGNGFRIVRLQAQNVKKLKAVDITPKPGAPLVIVAGNNGEGKTSVLDSIMWALAGKDVLPKDPIRHGQSTAVAEVDLGELIAKRTIGGKSPGLEVRYKDGRKQKEAPQTVLNALLGTLTFDPLEFSRMKAGDRLATLISLVKLDLNLTAHAAKRKEVFDRRTTINQRKRDLTGELRDIPEPDADLPTEPVDVAELVTEKNKREQAKRDKLAAIADYDKRQDALQVAAKDRDTAKDTLDSLPGKIEAQHAKVDALDDELDALAEEAMPLTSRRDDLMEQIRVLQAQLTECLVALEGTRSAMAVKQSQFDDAKKAEQDLIAMIEPTQCRVAEAQAKVDRLTSDAEAANPMNREWPDDDTASIDMRIAEAHELNMKIQRAADYAMKVSRLGAVTQEADELSVEIETLDHLKENALAAAEFPVDGLSFDDGDVSFNGILFDQLSSAEQLRVSLAMAMAMNPKLRVVRITDGSLLDETSLGIVREMAQEKGYQVWIECVGNRADATVLIEDGEVVGA